MNNKRLFKIAAFAASIAVLTGVVTFNIGSVVGAPTQSPPGDSVSPTFGGVKITGDTAVKQISSIAPGTAIKINENVDINGSINSLKFLNLSGDIKNSTAGAVKISDDLDVTGLISNSTSGSPVSINDDVTITGKISNTLGSVTINDLSIPLGKKLDVSGNSTFNGNLTLGNADGTSTIKTNAPITMSGGSLVRKIIGVSNVGNYTDNLWLETKNSLIELDQSGNINFKGALKGMDANPLYLKDNVEASGTFFNIISSGDISPSTWVFTIGSKVLDALDVQLKMDRDEIAVYNSDLKINYDSGTNVSIGSAGKTSNLAVSGKVTATGGFGTYAFRSSITYTLTAGKFSSSSAGCLAGEIAISCFANSYSADPGTSFYKNEAGDLSISGIYPSSSSCFANYKNNTASTKYFKTGVMCFDPTK